MSAKPYTAAELAEVRRLAGLADDARKRGDRDAATDALLKLGAYVVLITAPPQVHS